MVSPNFGVLRCRGGGAVVLRHIHTHTHPCGTPRKKKGREREPECVTATSSLMKKCAPRTHSFSATRRCTCLFSREPAYAPVLSLTVWCVGRKRCTCSFSPHTPPSLCVWCDAPWPPPAVWLVGPLRMYGCRAPPERRRLCRCVRLASM